MQLVRSYRRGCAGCGRYRVVRAEGFEPPRLASLEPKSSASTNSATPAAASLAAGIYITDRARGQRLQIACAMDGIPFLSVSGSRRMRLCLRFGRTKSCQGEAECATAALLYCKLK